MVLNIYTNRYNSGSSAGYTNGYNAGVAAGQSSPSIQYQSCFVEFSNMSSGQTQTVYTSFPHGAVGIVPTGGSGQKVFCTVSISGNSITFTLSAATTYTGFSFNAVGY